MMNLFDFVDEHGRNDILDWTEGLQKRDRAKLEQKLTRLVQISFLLAKETHLLAGPVHESIWKLRVNASVMLRPHLCKGPVIKDQEYTLLLGAIEIGDRLPDGIEKKALRRQVQVAASPLTRRIAHGETAARGIGHIE